MSSLGGLAVLPLTDDGTTGRDNAR